MMTRRQLLIAGPAAAAAAGILAGQEAPPFKIDFGYIDLSAEFPLRVAADTSGYTYCRVGVYAQDGSAVAQSKEWATEPNRPNSLEAPPPKKKGPYLVMAELRPTASRKPSMSAAVSQDPGIDLKLLETIADRVRFVTDPATRPAGGHFVLDMPLVSRVQVQIFRGEARTGTAVYEAQFDNAGPGPTPVPWDLHIKGGGFAPPGRYLACLVCTPLDPKRKGTKLFSTFGVV